MGWAGDETDTCVMRDVGTVDTALEGILIFISCKELLEVVITEAG